MNTPEQIVDHVLDTTPEWALSYRSAMIAAIEADRAKRDIYELIAEALDERGHMFGGEGELSKLATRAAEVIRSDEDDTIWTLYIGPMLDALEQNLGPASPSGA